MKKLLLLCSATLLLPTLGALTAPATKIRFTATQGAKWTRTFENKSEFSLDDMSVKINGQENSMMPEIEMTMNNDQKVVVRDEFVSLRGELPKVLKRKFDDLGSNMSVSMKIDMMGQSQNHDKNAKGKSQLAGKTVVFTWDEDKKEYRAAFDPTEENAELLAGLDEDMDLRVLLPVGEVKEGDEWDVDTKELSKLLAPGGQLKIKPEEDKSADNPMMGGDMSGMSGISDWFGDELSGTAKATFTGMREEKGAKLAVIKLHVKVKGSKDLTEMSKESINANKQPNMTMDVQSVDVEFEIEGDGELLWDLEAGHAQSFEFSGPASATIDISMKMEFSGQNMNIEQSLEMSGTNSISVQVD